MLKILDKIVISNYQPKQNNVVWIDSSDGNKIKIMNGSGWESVSGSSSNDSISQAKKEYYDRVLDDLAFSQEVQGICNSLTDNELASLFGDIEALNGLTPREALFMQVSDAYEIEDGEKHVDFSKLQTIGNGQNVNTPIFRVTEGFGDPEVSWNINALPGYIPNVTNSIIVFFNETNNSIELYNLTDDHMEDYEFTGDDFSLLRSPSGFAYMTISNDGSNVSSLPFGSFILKTRATGN